MIVLPTPSRRFALRRCGGGKLSGLVVVEADLGQTQGPFLGKDSLRSVYALRFRTQDERNYEMRRRIFTILLTTTFITNLAIAAELKPYFGLLHSHTSYSDGMGMPDEAYQYAKQAGLDFLAITDHCHDKAPGDDGIYLTQELYELTRQASERHTKNGEFVAICGQEFSTIGAGNHVNIFEASGLCTVDNGDFRTLYDRWLPDQPEVQFVQFNHPDYRKDQNPRTKAHKRNNDYGIDDYDNSFPDLAKACKDHVYLIELIIGPAFSEETNKGHFNGKHEKDYLFYLNYGFHLGPSVGQDNHRDNWGTSTSARLGVWVEKLTKEDLFDAIKKRRCYASEDENIQVKFKIKGKWMGDSVRLEPDEHAEIIVSISDPDEQNAKYRVKLFYDNVIGDDEHAEVVDDKTVEGNQDNVTFSHQHEQGGYYFIKVTQKSPSESFSDDVWTSPIWIMEEDVDDVEKDVLNWDEVDNYIGQEKVVTGTVVGTYRTPNIVFFNFDPDYRNTLSLVLKKAHFDAFGGAEAIEERLRGKEIKVKGVISVYKNRTQILLESPDQILSVKDSD